MSKIVSWNCNGGFRKKYEVLFEAYPDVDAFIIQECENPDFYNSKPYKALFQNGFYVGLPNYYMKGIGVFALKGQHLRRMRCDYINTMMMMGYALFVMNNNPILAVWSHGKYVEEMIDFFNSNKMRMSRKLLIIGDTNSATEFNNHHPKNKNHTVMVDMLKQYGLVDAYNHFYNEAEGKESMPTFYLQRKKEKPYHLDRAFISHSRIKDFKVASDHDFWLQYSDHIPILIEIEDIARSGLGERMTGSPMRIEKDKVQCAKCVYADRSEIELSDSSIVKDARVFGAFCEQYPDDFPRSMGKPDGIIHPKRVEGTFNDYDYIKCPKFKSL